MTSVIGERYISDTQMRFEAPVADRRSKPGAIELFAGVGGFRLGLEEHWDVIWSNQWEPSTKTQHASDVYVNRFGDTGHVCQDINEVLQRVREEETTIPPHDLLVGGFPCQDYSVARVLSQATGLVGKKGVLWWSIHEILSRYQPRFVLLENVDRLLKSPANQRGRDFAIILGSLAQLGYRVQWRVVNAADYGFPQRRRRVFIVAERTEEIFKDPIDEITNEGILARALPVIAANGSDTGEISVQSFGLDERLDVISETFGLGLKTSPFQRAGIMQDYQVHTLDVEPYFDGERVTLGDILQPHETVDEKFFIPTSQLSDWSYLKGAKNEKRTHRNSGTPYVYSEGAIAFPDPLDKPSRTVLTGEGGPSPSRFKHVIETPDGRFRRLTPKELELLNGFPGDWTTDVPDGRRAFLMGNALVVGIVARISSVLREELERRKPSQIRYQVSEPIVATHTA